jgi:ArsR family metal-binding transcriptional regulator
MTTKSEDLSGNPVPKKETKLDLKKVLPALPLHQCVRCGFRGHFAVTCKATKDLYGNEIVEEDEGYTSDKYY